MILGNEPRLLNALYSNYNCFIASNNWRHVLRSGYLVCAVIEDGYLENWCCIIFTTMSVIAVISLFAETVCQSQEEISTEREKREKSKMVKSIIYAINVLAVIRFICQHVYAVL